VGAGGYDLVCIASPTWWFNPCMPIRSFMESELAGTVLAGKRFAAIVVCHRYWKTNLATRYVLATYFQENLKYVQPGQPVEVSLDLYPGQIFSGKVDAIWRGNGVGQYLPSDEIPKFQPLNPNIPQGQYAAKILLDDADQLKFPIGAQGSTAIYTGGEYGAWAALRKISIRAHSWFNWLYPINF
jgi:hypothetical protein